MKPHLIAGGRGTHRDVSVIVPARDEERSLPSLIERVGRTLDEQGMDWEIVVVDDGSLDGSAATLRALASDRIRPLILDGNHGKSAALACGLDAARGALVVLMDADLQDLPEEMPALLAPIRAGQLDLAQGWRTDRQDTAFKCIASRVFNGLCTAASGLRVHDVNCGYKAMHRDVARRIRLSRGMHRFLPVLAWRQGFRVGEVPVRHAHRAFGASRYGVWRYLRGLNDLVSVVLLPRVLGVLAPLLTPAGLLSLLGAAAMLALLAWMGATGRSGQLWEIGLSALGLFATGLLCLTLGTIERLGADLERSDQRRIWRLREAIEPPDDRAADPLQPPSGNP